MSLIRRCDCLGCLHHAGRCPQRIIFDESYQPQPTPETRIMCSGCGIAEEAVAYMADEEDRTSAHLVPGPWRRARVRVPLRDIASGREQPAGGLLWVRRMALASVDPDLGIWLIWDPDGPPTAGIVAEAIELLDEYSDDPGALPCL